ncbi:MAG: hypothetical protein ACYC3O_10150 [Burkholderiales bacterium]
MTFFDVTPPLQPCPDSRQRHAILDTPEWSIAFTESFYSAAFCTHE